ncbi:MAG: nucleotide exchange factor GrpE, partial [Planctomycetales bacterium]
MKAEELLTEQPNIDTDKRQPIRRQPESEEAKTGIPDDGSPQADVELSETEQLQMQLHDADNRALRAQADLDNYRKRVQREQEQDRRYATMRLLQDLLPMVDNVQRA